MALLDQDIQGHPKVEPHWATARPGVVLQNLICIRKSRLSEEDQAQASQEWGLGGSGRKTIKAVTHNKQVSSFLLLRLIKMS